MMHNNLNLPEAVAVAMGLKKPTCLAEAIVDCINQVELKVKEGTEPKLIKVEERVGAHTTVLNKPKRMEGWILWSPQRNKQHMVVYDTPDEASVVATDYAKNHGFTYYVCLVGNGYVDTVVEQDIIERRTLRKTTTAVVRI